MASYRDNETIILYSDHYFDFFERRGIKFAKIKRTKTFEKVQGLELKIRKEHIWSHGDNLLKLARTYYGNDDLWTVIALINKKPTDAHYSIGDVVYIVENPGIIKGAM